MIYFYTILYSIYLFFFMDTLLATPNYWLQAEYSSIFLIISAVLYCYNAIFKKQEIKKSYFIRKELTTFIIFLIILLVHLFQYGRELTNWEVVLCEFLLISNIFMIGKIYSQYNKKNLFLFASLVIPSIFIIKYGLFSSTPPSESLNNIYHIFSNQERVRFAFNFNHPNTLGNVILTMFIISFIYIFNTLKEKRNIILKILSIILAILLIIPLGYMLICTASRNSILALIIFVSLSIYFIITNIKFIPLILKIILKIVIILVVGINAYNYVNTNYDALFDASNRRGNFEVNLPNIDTEEEKNFGLGLIYYGDFGGKKVSEINTSDIDNYYLYLLVCTGRVGLVIILICLVIIGLKVYLNIYINPSIEASLIFAAFIAHMFSGIGETCVLYFTFPIGLILMSLYVITIDDLYYKLSDLDIINKIKKKFEEQHGRKTIKSI